MIIPPLLIKITEEARGTSQWRNKAVHDPSEKAMPSSSHIIKEDEKPSRGREMSA